MEPPPDAPLSDAASAVNQPGLAALREAAANAFARFRRPASLRQDVLAGLNSALGSAPDGMANGILAGVNPVYGLYATAAGPLAGGALSSTQLMVVTSTSAAAIAANAPLAALPADRRDEALFLMVLLVGAFQVVFGLLGLGRLVRFVSYSVMTGFLMGVAALMVLSQVPTVAGYAAEGANKVTQALDVLAHLDQAHAPTLALAGLTLLLVVVLPRTRLGPLGSLVAIVVPSVLVAVFGWEDVRLVRDVGAIPRGLPAPFLPSLAALSPGVVTAALAVAAITLVQGTGVAQSVPNPDGSRSRVSRDFIAQGAANLAAGFFRGLPVGGSLSSTALSVSAGARSRWAAIFTGVWMVAVVLVFPAAVERVAMPALGALLIVAGARMIRPAEVRAILGVGWPSVLACGTTFLATLFLPIQAAVGLGVVLSALLFVNASSNDVTIVALVERPDGQIEERTAPARLPDRAVTVLDVYGSLFYAGARTFERRLPNPRGAERPVVVLRLRGRPDVGATLVEVLARYADALAEAGGRLYLSGLDARALAQIARTGKLQLDGPVRAYEAAPVVGASTRAALADAEAWLVAPDAHRA